MTVRELTRRTAFRIAVMFASLFIVTVAILFAVLYQLITTEIERRLKSHIIEVRDTLIAVGAWRSPAAAAHWPSSSCSARAGA